MRVNKKVVSRYGLGFTMENGEVKMALDWHRWKAKLEQEGVESKPMYWYRKRNVALFGDAGELVDGE